MLNERPKTAAKLILAGFDQYRQGFKALTSEAKDRFEQADWIGIQQASTARIRSYKKGIGEVLHSFETHFGDEALDLEEWHEAKAIYLLEIGSYTDFDLAETVFNTIFRKTHQWQQVHDEYCFVRQSFNPAPRFDVSLTRSYGPDGDLAGLLGQIFKDYRFDTPYLNVEQDIELIVSTMQTCIPLLRQPRKIAFEILKPVFYRNKGAYLIGKMLIGEHLFPIAIPIGNDGCGVYVDAIIWNENDLSIIFSFTRSYFMVDVEYPNEMVEYLSELLPNKKRWELYTALGFYKHGKTEFYRGFLSHLEQSNDQFVVADGIKGLVMMVFTLPSYNTVFKIIKDKFPATKKVTHKQVKDAYYLVKTHDRVGRMADTQEFENFVLPRNRFSEELLEELQKVASASVSLDDEWVTIKHLYTERLMIPLNLYIKDRTDHELRMALDECGNAIKQLAAANIFAGDMLLKNFGVTRHGRVVFYDYDDICYLTEVNFRDIPKPRYPEDLMAAEPWYSVGPNDVFPEEFVRFLFHSPRLKELFCENHADLFTAKYWQELQQNIRNDKVMDVYPYRRKRRFARSN